MANCDPGQADKAGHVRLCPAVRFSAKRRADRTDTDRGLYPCPSVRPPMPRIGGVFGRSGDNQPSVERLLFSTCATSRKDGVWRAPEKFPQKMRRRAPENSRTPGLRAPPRRHPPEEGPGATMCRRLSGDRTTGSTLPLWPVSRPGAPPRWRCARTSGNHTARGSATRQQLGPASSRPPAVRPDIASAALDLLPVNPARPIRADGFTPNAGTHLLPDLHYVHCQFSAMIAKGEKP